MLKTTLQTKTVGTLLIEKRKEKGLEIRDVSLALKIRSEYLLALEEGRYNVFRSEVYLTGFLKNYAKFLGIDSEKILAMYRRENERRNLGDENVIPKLGNNGINLTLTPNKIVAILSGLAVLLVLIYLGTYVGRVLKKPEISLTSPVAIALDAEGAYNTDANLVELVGTAEIGSKLTINDQELKLNNFEKFSQEFNLEPGINTFIIKGENQFGRTSTITLTVTRNASMISITPTPTPLVLSVSMEIVKKDTNIIVLVDGVIKTDRIYKVGSMLEFTAFKSFELQATNIASVNFKLNGISETLTQNSTWEIINGEIVKK